MLNTIITSRNEGQLSAERVYNAMAKVTEDQFKAIESRSVAYQQAKAKAQFEVDVQKSFWVCVDVRIIGQFKNEQEIKDYSKSGQKDHDLFCERFKILAHSKDAATLATPVMFFGENPTKNMLVCAKTLEDMQEG